MPSPGQAVNRKAVDIFRSKEFQNGLESVSYIYKRTYTGYFGIIEKTSGYGSLDQEKKTITCLKR